MKKTIIVTLLALFLVGLVLALDVHIYDDTGFEIDVFNTGESVMIIAETEEPEAFISILDAGIDKDPMQLEDEELYSYEFIPEEKGEYEVEVSDSADIVLTKVFVTQGLDLDWDKMAEENKEIISKEPGTVVEHDRTAWQKLIDYIKHVLGIING